MITDPSNNLILLNFTSSTYPRPVITYNPKFKPIQSQLIKENSIKRKIHQKSTRSKKLGFNEGTSEADSSRMCLIEW